MSERPSPVRVLVIEDEGLFRDMLQTALAMQPTVEVVAAVATGEAAIREADRVVPDVVLADIELGPGLNGIEAASRIRAKHPNVGVVLLSAHRDKQYIASLPAGEARGWSYLLKSSVTDTATLVRAIEGAASGLVVLDPALVDALRPRPRSPIDNLSERQRQVLALMAKGYSNGGIAQELVLTEKTVENYVGSIFQALNIDREEAIHPRVKAVLAFLEGTQGT
ncbi:MAG: response regulator transcription factor [Chloroflexi bacterium]|nr:response regulator transcription factor [Chloroflexota bacterium]